MGVEIRPAKPEEMEEFRHVVSSALVEAPEIYGEAPYLARTAEWTMCAFEDGKLATGYRSFLLTMQFNGGTTAVAAINSVGTLPIYRRRGYLRKVTTAHFELLHERGEQAIAIVWPSRAVIYQRYGYAYVTTNNAYNVDPRYLEFTLPRPVAGTFREVGDDKLPLLVDIYRKFRAERTGYLDRGRDWNSDFCRLELCELLPSPPTGGLLTKVVYEEAGEPLGYVIYTVQDEVGADQRIQRVIICDLIWLKFSAYQAIWNYFANMDLVGNIIWERAPSDDPLPHLLLEPRRLSTASRNGILGRIVDVEKALPKRRYDEEGTLTFEVIDDLCPWNHGRWKLKASTTESSISRTSDEPQMVMPVSTLAMLVFGQISATEAGRMERLDVLEDSALSMWDRVMKTKYRPCCPDRF